MNAESEADRAAANDNPAGGEIETADGVGQPEGQPATRSGFVAVIGAPNAGKSTLVNAMVGAKVTIVSHKVQTTRMPVRGIAMVGASQLVFVDTPGIFVPKRRLDRAMVEAAWGGAGDADVVAMIVDAARGLDEDVSRILEKLRSASNARLVLLLNKVDRVSDKGRLLKLAEELTKRVAFERVFMISALNCSGVEDFKAYLAGVVPEGPWLYPEDDISDIPLRLLAAEITRERIYHLLHDELPYAITVETTDWKELRDKSVRIEQTVYVERDSQKSIVLGKGGRTVKQVSSEARKELQSIVERPVHLFVFVKVREGWGNDPERYRDIGLTFPKD
ncbi:MAG: GTPase Era [Alphaproteobacteria bacterium]|nr:GTPase Era [Alphaproteobacteria bacterium]